MVLLPTLAHYYLSFILKILCVYKYKFYFILYSIIEVYLNWVINPFVHLDFYLTIYSTYLKSLFK